MEVVQSRDTQPCKSCGPHKSDWNFRNRAYADREPNRDFVQTNSSLTSINTADSCRKCQGIQRLLINIAGHRSFSKSISDSASETRHAGGQSVRCCALARLGVRARHTHVVWPYEAARTQSYGPANSLFVAKLQQHRKLRGCDRSGASLRRDFRDGGPSRHVLCVVIAADQLCRTRSAFFQATICSPPRSHFSWPQPSRFNRYLLSVARAALRVAGRVAESLERPPLKQALVRHDSAVKSRQRSCMVNKRKQPASATSVK